jgi:ribosomal protein L4
MYRAAHAQSCFSELVREDRLMVVDETSELDQPKTRELARTAEGPRPRAGAHPGG